MSEEAKWNFNLIEYIALDEQAQEPANLERLYRDCVSAGLQPLIEAYIHEIAKQARKLAEGMPGGFFIYHADGDEEIIYANNAMLLIFGCNTMEEFRELTGNTFRGLVYPDDLDEVEASISRQISESQYDLDYVEYRIRRRDGEIRWIDDYGHFVSSEIGDLFYVFIGDATEKRRSQMEQREALVQEADRKERHWKSQLDEYNRKLKVISQEQLRRLEVIEGLSIDYESIFYADLDQNMLKPYRVSERIERAFGRDDAFCEFAGSSDRYIDTWVHPEDRAMLRKATSPEYIRERLSKDISYHVNYRVVYEGALEYQQMRVVDVGVGDHISQIVLGYRSVDEEIRQEMEQKKAFEEAMNQARAANIAKNTFLANMSHDLRTPMTAIVGFAELAKSHIDEPERVLHYLDKIEDSGGQLLGLLNDVLEISRMESGRAVVRETPCSLMDIVRDVHAELLPQAEGKRIALPLDFEGIEHVDVECDGGMLRQMLRRLAGNAIKYTREGGHVCITVIEKKQTAAGCANYQFVIEDNGIGIGPGFLPRLYEPFERERNTTMSGVRGTGLGLTIVKNIVDMMGGTIGVESRVGAGSRFTVSLSFRLQASRENDAAEDGEDLAALLAGRKILLVEDNEINLEIETELLQQAGLEVDTATDGSIALEKLRGAKPDEYALVLMDIQMPVMDGYQAARVIRSLEQPQIADIPIIALSANTFYEDRQKSAESGMNAHVGKPIDLPELMSLMRKLLGAQG